MRARPSFCFVVVSVGRRVEVVCSYMPVERILHFFSESLRILVLRTVEESQMPEVNNLGAISDLLMSSKTSLGV